MRGSNLLHSMILTASDVRMGCWRLCCHSLVVVVVEAVVVVVVVVVTVVVVVVVVVVAVVEARKEIGGRPCTCSRFLLGSFDFSLPTFPIRM